MTKSKPKIPESQLVKTQLAKRKKRNSKRKDKKKSFVLWLLEAGKYLLVGGLLLFTINFFFPNAMKDVRHMGWFDLSNIEFDFTPLETDNTFDPYEKSVRQFTITNNYVQMLNPFLFIEGNYSNNNIGINCTDNIGNVCQNGFRIPAGEPTPMNLNFVLNNATKGTHTLQFKIVAGKEHEFKNIEILVE